MGFHLYIDTSEYLIVGLLDKEFSWVQIHENSIKKSSAIVHFLIYDLLSNHDLAIDDIENVFIANGPGSYTGVRVGEGIGQIFDWQKINVYSFCHYHVPSILGCLKGRWFCSAFKGEHFVASWENNERKEVLVKSTLVADILYDENLYTHFEDQDLFEKDVDFTSDIIVEKSIVFFPLLIQQKFRSEPFYFRKAESEFKIGGKK